MLNVCLKYYNSLAAFTELKCNSYRFISAVEVPRFSSGTRLVFRMILSQFGLLWSVLLLLRSPSLWADTFGEQCIDSFQRGEEDFVLDTDLSVKEGATFIASPTVTRAKDCVRSCCKDPRCNLALMEDEADEGMIKACFLFDCVYKQTYVCKMARKKGFSNYIMKTVFDEYLKGPSGFRKS